MSEHILKSHNKSLLLYHIVCPAKYRRKVFSREVEETLIGVCKGIEERFEIFFLEIGADRDHVHFLVQSVPSLSPFRIVQVVKSVTAIKVFEKHPEVKKILWGGNFWTSGYYINTVGATGSEQIIQTYVESQGQQYKNLYRNQMSIQFD